jgi:gentisate 1,2-dioxygenase
MIADTDLNLATFEDLVQEEQLSPLWKAMRGDRGRLQPHLWRWQHVRQRMFQAADLIPVGKEGAHRRVLLLQNPGVPRGVMGTTQTLVIGIQFIHGKEVAPSHRHSAAALRFIMEGQGACTIVNGEPESMNVGDLLLTPSWYWHGHYSEHDEPMIWMDCLDAPLVANLGVGFGEEYPELIQPASAPRDESIRQFSAGGLIPVGQAPTNQNSPLLNYRWAQTEEQLLRLIEREGSPYDGVALRYANPYTGGPVMPTIDCWIQLLRPNEHTQAHRHTGSVVYNVVRGSGSTIINGERFDWTRGDIFCVPSWACHEHLNTSTSDDAVLFSVTDSPVLHALGLYREAAYEENGGHQEVTSSFTPV